MNALQETAHPFVEKICRTICSHGMIPPGSKILAGFSGGPDSTALARVLQVLAPRLGTTLGLAHLNHGLRGKDADRDEEFARAFAGTRSLELIVEHHDIKAMAERENRSVEEAGRIARYDFFKRTATENNYTCIALGHHWDDHTEQVLMNLLRGTGPQGLKGIPPVREGGIVRPLIHTPKSEILAFLRDISQPFVTDDSNKDSVFLRNRIRNRLIPFMEKAFNPDIRAGLDRLSRITALEDDFMEGHAKAAYEKIKTEEGAERVALAANPLVRLHPAIAGRVIRKALFHVKQDLQKITHRHIRDILALAEVSEPGKHLDLPAQIRVYRLKESLGFQRESLPLRELGRLEKAKKQQD